MFFPELRTRDNLSDEKVAEILEKLADGFNVMESCLKEQGYCETDEFSFGKCQGVVETLEEGVFLEDTLNSAMVYSNDNTVIILRIKFPEGVKAYKIGGGFYEEVKPYLEQRQLPPGAAEAELGPDVRSP